MWEPDLVSSSNGALEFVFFMKIDALCLGVK